MYSRLSLLFVFVSCFVSSRAAHGSPIVPADAQVKKYLPLLQGKRVGLVINQTSVVGDSTLLDMLLVRKVQVKTIFVPEHGFRGLADAGAHIDNSVDSATGLPLISLYGSHKQPKQEELDTLDVLVYDLQDVGTRFYTYISTLEYCLDACAAAGKQFIVLDRPNPNGFYIDGPVLEKANTSFVGMQPIPIVYGMTAGEYAQMLVGERWIAHAADAQLTVVPCSGYDHSRLYKLPVAPSPNLRTMAAIYAYPSLCLFEGTPISVGRGTDLPFQQFGCPGFAGHFTYHFTPQAGPGAKNPPYERKECFGETVGDEQQLLRTLSGHLHLAWLIKAYAAYPEKNKFFTPFFTKLSGTASLMEQVANGKTEQEIRKSWEPALSAFKLIRKKYLLYKDF